MHDLNRFPVNPRGGTRCALHQYAALPVDRCRAESGERPSRLAARRRTDGLCVMDAPSQASPRQSGVARSRSLHPVGRTWFDAVVQPASSNRLRPAARSDRALPAIGQPHARPSGARPHAGRRDVDRPARPGLRQRRRHGDGGSAARRVLQPSRLRDRGSPHLRTCQRRRPDGRRRSGSRIACRPSPARQADLPVRRQSGHTVRRHRYHLHRRSRATVRRLRLAYRNGRRRQRSGRNRRGAGQRTCRAAASVVDPRAHASRLWLAQPARHLPGARIAARRRRGAPDQAQPRVAARPRVSYPRTGARAFSSRADGGARTRRSLERAVRSVCARVSRAGRRAAEHGARHVARPVGPRYPGFSGRSERHGNAGCFRQGAECPRLPRPFAGRRLRRSESLDLHRADRARRFRGCRHERARPARFRRRRLEPRRPQSAFSVCASMRWARS